MVLTTTTETVDFVAPWRESDPQAARFRLRAGSVIERGQMEAELSSTHRAGRVYDFELRAAIKAGVETLLADDPEMDHVIELIDAEAEGEAVTLSDADKRLLTEVRQTLAEHWPEYRDMVAQLERRRELTPIVALRRFCVGIEGEGITFTLGRDGMVSDATMSALDRLEMVVAGNRAFGLQYATGAERFLAPASSLDDDQPSSSPAPSPAAGSSAKKGGRKTPGSRSPRGSGPS